jgi:hypothetical protein
MSRTSNKSSHHYFHSLDTKIFGGSLIKEAFEALEIMNSSGRPALEKLPFAADDATAGTETELQAAVHGTGENVDLPIIIEQSNYLANIRKRTATGDLPKRLVHGLEEVLHENTENIWENSWVRFERRMLSNYAEQVFERDLKADKSSPSDLKRTDVSRFVFSADDGRPMIRVPVSYLVKLAMAQFIGLRKNLPFLLRETGTRLMGHYLNDNTSPETFSFHVVPMRKSSGMGLDVAREASKRMLLTQLLVMYANRNLGLRDSGQNAMIYFAPHPPLRQKFLNDHISDSFYRDLFLSPCLSGWDRGEEKYRYMRLCHKVLSRSQLNAVAKLKHAGIIQNNLVVLPNLSNVSLANNGTHVSLGSRKLTAAMIDGTPQFTSIHEKYIGDLVIKIAEHFLPLFAGTYSAAPYRLGYTDFHPEKALGFLAHELDYTHLRALWRMWKNKAGIRIFGTPVTPFGPVWLDRMLSVVFNLKGDFVHDFRLIDYLVCLLSTDSSPALDGSPGNAERLKSDLAELGIFDQGMSPYLLIKLREFSKMGFSGFESRQYSLFESLRDDMANAVNLQLLIKAFAFKMIAEGKVLHADIPDTPDVESERRQMFFGDAIGLPSFYVRKDTGNRLLLNILKKAKNVRPSGRYQNYLKVRSSDYRFALARFLTDEAGEMVDMLGLRATMGDLMARLRDDNVTASGKLTRGILGSIGARDRMAVSAAEFNSAAERYYRSDLCAKHMREAFTFMEKDYSSVRTLKEGEKTILKWILGSKDAADFLNEIRDDVINDGVSEDDLGKLISLVVLSIHHDIAEAGRVLAEDCR